MPTRERICCLPRLTDLLSFTEHLDHVTVDGRDFPLIDQARPDEYALLYESATGTIRNTWMGCGSEAVTRLLLES